MASDKKEWWIGNVDGKPALSENERKAIRIIIEKEKRWKWLAEMSRNVAVWVAAVVGSWILFKDFVVNAIKGIAGQ